MRYQHVFILLLLVPTSLYAGFGHKRAPAKDTMQHMMLDTIEVSSHEDAPPYQPSATRVWDINHTHVAISFNWKEKTADAREWIKMHPYCYPTDTIALDAKSMRIDSVALQGKTGTTPLRYSYKDNKLVVQLGHTYTAHDSVTLYLKYQAMPYAAQTGGSAAITDDRGLYFINTDYSVPNKPAQIWTQGETESNSHWMITIDKPNTRFTTEIEMTVPDSFTTLSNGAMVKQVKLAGGKRTDIWKMDMPIQAYVVMMAVGKFSVIKDKWKNKEVNYYVEPEYAPYARQMFNNTPEMIDYFSQRTGVPYPWNKYSQVVVRDYVSGAMENTSATLHGDFINQTARELKDKNSEDVVSHELFHQWFGDYVTAESWTNITVNESFANYGEQLWRAHKYGKTAGDELAWNDLQTYIYSSQYSKDPQLVRFNYDSREEVFDAISYNKGGAILHYLNTLMGDEAFDLSMKTYLTKNALHSAEAHNWRLAIEEATGQDWNWFFNEYYYHAGHPVLKVNYFYNDTVGKLMMTVNQTQTDSTFNYRLPLKTAVFYGKDKQIVDWTINKRKDTFTYAYKSGVRPLVVPDCQHILPGELKDTKKPEQLYQQFTTCDDYLSKRVALSGAARMLSDSTNQETVRKALNDEMKAIRRSALGQLSNVKSEKNQKKWSAKVMEMAVSDKDISVRAEAMDLLSTWKLAAAKNIFINAVGDSSYLIAGNALEGLSKIDKDTAYIMAKLMLKTDPRSYLADEIWTIIGEHAAEGDVALFAAKAPYILGRKKFAFAAALNSYMKHVKNDASFSTALNAYVPMVTTESMRSYRTTLGGFLFQSALALKTDSPSDDPAEAAKETATAKTRLAMLKPALQKITDAETDTETADGYKKKMKRIFEEE